MRVTVDVPTNEGTLELEHDDDNGTTTVRVVVDRHDYSAVVDDEILDAAMRRATGKSDE